MDSKARPRVVFASFLKMSFFLCFCNFFTYKIVFYKKSGLEVNMRAEKFTLQQYSIGAILGLIDINDFVIPEIQRPFVWKKSQLRDLIDSLYNGYPTGYIIVWKNPDVQTKDGIKANGKRVLIDGQ